MKWKYPLLLLAGIGISNIGAWVYLIALNLMILNMTGSAFSVAVLYILIPAAALTTHFWAGSVVDRMNKRRMMICLDVFRAVLIIILPFLDHLIVIYVLVFFINIGAALFEPASMIYMTKLIDKGKRQKFNALRNFINSSGFVIGPSIAGALFIIGTPELAIMINAAALLMSAYILTLLPDVEVHAAIVPEKLSLTLIVNDWLSIMRFSKENGYTVLIYVLFSGVMISMSALDSLEAAFATVELMLSESTYGVLVSIAGAGIISGSVVNAVFSHRLNIHHLLITGALLTPSGYVIFACSNGFLVASAGVFILTFGLAFLNTGFLTYYQDNVPADIMGRFQSVFGMFESICIIVFTIVMGISAETFDIRPVYTLGASVFFLLGLVFTLSVMKGYRKGFFRAA